MTAINPKYKCLPKVLDLLKEHEWLDDEDIAYNKEKYGITQDEFSTVWQALADFSGEKGDRDGETLIFIEHRTIDGDNVENFQFVLREFSMGQCCWQMIVPNDELPWEEEKKKVFQVIKDKTHFCPRIEVRMECPECGYPLCEARYILDERLPHMEEEDLAVVQHALENGQYTLDDGFKKK